MQLYLVLAFSVFLTVYSVNERVFYGKNSVSEITQIKSSSVAYNIYLYNDIAYQYLETNYYSIINGNYTISNYIGYNTNYVLDVNSIKALYDNSAYSYVARYNYTSSYFIYQKDTSSVASIYLLTMWTDDEADKTKPSILALNTFSELNKILQGKTEISDTNLSVMSVYGFYNQKTSKVDIYSLLPSDHNRTNDENTVATTINTLKSRGFNFGNRNYFYLTPVYINE